MRTNLHAWGTVLALAFAACSPAIAPVVQPPTGQQTAPIAGGTVRTFELTAAPNRIELQPGVAVNAWTFNGTVPGPALRVQEGDLIQVHLHNRLPVGTTIHWHGLSVPNGQDGVAGVTQDPVPPGQSATYSFVASTAGTYWYHSHQDAAAQVDRGLYGLLIVDPHGGKANDAVLVYDEWSLGLQMTSPPASGDPAMSAYVTVSVNGKAGTAIEPLKVVAGRKFRLRILNAGYLVHFVRLRDVPVTVVAFDGHEVIGGAPTNDVLPVGPGERLDVELTAPDRAFWIDLQESFPPSAEAALQVSAAGASPSVRPRPAVTAIRPVLDIFTYGAGAPESPWPRGGVPTKTFTLTLTEVLRTQGPPVKAMPGMDMGEIVYEINGEAFPAMDPLEVTLGDLVAISFVNHGRQDHPMHLHGHAFQLLEKNGVAVLGVIVKDTVIVRPGTSVTIGFLADNPGWWMIHCHQLHHSAAGMMTLLRYAGSPRLAQLGGPLQGKPD